MAVVTISHQTPAHFLIHTYKESPQKVKMGGKILRVTMFKIPEKENQLQLAENYKRLSTEALKVWLFPIVDDKRATIG